MAPAGTMPFHRDFPVTTLPSYQNLGLQDNHGLFRDAVLSLRAEETSLGAGGGEGGRPGGGQIEIATESTGIRCARDCSHVPLGAADMFSATQLTMFQSTHIS